MRTHSISCHSSLFSFAPDLFPPYLPLRSAPLRVDAHVFTPSELEFYSRRQNAYDFFKRSWTGADAGWPRFILGSPMQVASTMMAKQNLEKLVKDPKLREMLTPTCWLPFFSLVLDRNLR